MEENNLVDVSENIKNEIKSNEVVLFMKGTPVFPMCGFSAAIVQVLSDVGVKFSSVNVLDIKEKNNSKIKECVPGPCFLGAWVLVLCTVLSCPPARSLQMLVGCGLRQAVLAFCSPAQRGWSPGLATIAAPHVKTPWKNYNFPDL